MRVCGFLWKLIKLLPLGVVLPLVILAASVSPHDAVSNLSKWITAFGVHGLPSWLINRAADNWALVIGIALATAYASALWGIPYWRKKSLGPFFYFRADTRAPVTRAGETPFLIVNDERRVFEDGSWWVSPASANRNPDPKPGPYWTLGHLRGGFSTLHTGEIRLGTSLAPGAYCIEFQATRDGVSYGFVEFLELRDNGEQAINVWKHFGVGEGRKNYKLVMRFPHRKRIAKYHPAKE
jgi:hypothetical protein